MVVIVPVLQLAQTQPLLRRRMQGNYSSNSNKRTEVETCTLQNVRSCTGTCSTSKCMIHVFGAHAYDRCNIVAEFFLLCRSISTVCSFFCWVRHYDRKKSPDKMEHNVHTFESLSPESYTGMRIAKEHVRILYSALSLCTILHRIV